MSAPRARRGPTRAHAGSWGAPWRAGLLALAACVAIGPLSPAPTRAEEPGGAITGQLFVSDGDVGASGLIDVWARLDALRVGGFFGVVALPSARDFHDRTMMPAGLRAALALEFGDVDLELVLRVGAFGGASQEDKLFTGVLVGGGPYLDVRLVEGVALGVGVEAFGYFGGGDTWALSPGLRLAWGPSADEREESAR